ncbi:hypothetical protein [Litoribrevibacter albus]|uniref:Uncharacterized protein n=1 Tax=Litoribrevibacter albus TaxID=1473156 RepID=A0AA37W5U1_9GAMM|nr:hypothetical protein [Litoribrevibacter albus]GLQ29818.1 hypothetical protein GCM10007876_02960 [Litoribrevibacter albus]
MSFHTSQAAINILKVGKKHPRWREAAEFIIERATPEVKLLLAVGRQLERDEIQQTKEQRASSFSWQPFLKYALIALVSAGVSGVSVYILVSLIKLC